MPNPLVYMGGEFASDLEKLVTGAGKLSLYAAGCAVAYTVGGNLSDRLKQRMKSNQWFKFNDKVATQLSYVINAAGYCAGFGFFYNQNTKNDVFTTVVLALGTGGLVGVMEGIVRHGVDHDNPGSPYRLGSFLGWVASAMPDYVIGLHERAQERKSKLKLN